MPEGFKSGGVAPGGEYISGDIYRVKPVDKDTGRNQGEQFESELNRKKKGKQGDADSGNEQAAAETPVREIPVREDEIILSEQAKKVLAADKQLPLPIIDDKPSIAPDKDEPGANVNVVA